MTWTGSSNHFENEFNRVKDQLHTILKEGKVRLIFDLPFNCFSWRSRWSQITRTVQMNLTWITRYIRRGIVRVQVWSFQHSHSHGEIVIALRLHYNVTLYHNQSKILIVFRIEEKLQQNDSIRDFPLHLKWKMSQSGLRLSSTVINHRSIFISYCRPTFESCDEPVVIYELRGGALPDRKLNKVQ